MALLGGHQPTHDRVAGGRGLSQRSVDDLCTELAQLRERIGRYPDHLADQLHEARNARAEAQRAGDNARTRVAELQQSRGLLRRRAGDPPTLAFERERLKLAEHQVAAAAERERDLVARVPDRAAWEAERRELRERADALDTQLSIRRREQVRDALDRPRPYLIQALGELPDQPRARRTWQQTAQRIETYRFDHAITDTHQALGPRPPAMAAREDWRRAHQDLHRAQRDLARRVEHSLGHEL